MQRASVVIYMRVGVRALKDAFLHTAEDLFERRFRYIIIIIILLSVSLEQELPCCANKYFYFYYGLIRANFLFAR